MESFAPTFSGKTPFHVFAQLLEKLTTERGQKKKEILDQFFQRYGWGDFYQVYRLFLPQHDTERRSYSMKEKVIARLYVEALSIDPSSESAQRLLNYRTPTKDQPSAGDFGTAVYSALVGRARKESTLTIAQVNNYLDNLATAPDTETRKRILIQMVRESTALMQKWIVRIVVKDLKIGSGEKLFLTFLHPDAPSLFNVSTNLKKVCEELIDPNVRSVDKMVQLFSLIKPMLAGQVPPNEVLQTLSSDEFVIETKFDGNRYQVHRKGDKMMIFSRKGRETTGFDIIEPYLKQCIKGDSWIIDGEMMAWDENERKFGKFKEVRSILAGLSDKTLMFIVFDVLMLNGISVLNQPLRERIGLLKNSFNPVEGKVELVKRQVATTLQQIEKAVDIAIENREEGIMIKSLDEVYMPGVRKWIKIKPDYLHGIGDNLDLVVLGGFYGEGTGARSGTPSHFVVGIRAPDTVGADGSAQPERWYSLLKVGTGYSYSELATLQYKLQPHWKVWNKASPPRFIELTPTAEVPDVYVNPRDCCIVLEIMGASFEESDKYRMGWTMRHPRVYSIRSDKGIDDLNTYEEVQALIERGQLASGLMSAGGVMGTLANKKARKKKAKPNQGNGAGMLAGSLAPSFKAGDVAVEGSIFSGLQMTVVLMNKQEKREIEEMIVKQGGVLAAFPNTNSFCVVSEPNNVRLNLLSKYDVVKSNWVRECVAEGKRLPFVLRNMIYQTEKTRVSMLEEADEFGDSYTAPVTPSVLKLNPNSEFNLNHAFTMQSEIFDEPPSFALFSGLVFFFDPAAIGSLKLAQLIALHYQGAMTTTLSWKVTHVIMKESFPENFENLRSKVNQIKTGSRKIQIVSSDWIIQSAEQGERLVESSFAMKAVNSKKKRERHLIEQQKEKETLAKEVLIKSMSASLN